MANSSTSTSTRVVKGFAIFFIVVDVLMGLTMLALLVTGGIRETDAQSCNDAIAASKDDVVTYLGDIVAGRNLTKSTWCDAFGGTVPNPCGKSRLIRLQEQHGYTC